MAFVYKSDRILGKENSLHTDIGPGQYLPQTSIRNLKPIKHPFCSSTFRETKVKKEDVPGPGSYDYDDKYEKFASLLLDRGNKSPSFLKSMELAASENIDPFTIIINKENQKDVGFLSKEKRFKEPASLINENPGPGKYQKHEPLLLIKNSIKDKKKKLPKVEKGKLTLLRYDRSPGSPNCIATIPSKFLSYGYDINDNGELVMKEDPEKDLKHKGELNDTVGPGSYDTLKSRQWFKNMVSWEKLSKTSREINNKRDILISQDLHNSAVLKDVVHNSTMIDLNGNGNSNNLNKSIITNLNNVNNINSENIKNNINIHVRNSNNMLNSSTPASLSINPVIPINTGMNLFGQKAESIIVKEKQKIEKEKVFKHIREKRQQLLDLKTMKGGFEDELLNKHLMKQEPGPGYYNTEMACTSFKKPNVPEKFQTFGTSSLRFQENQGYEIGPGTYFKDDQRLEKIKLKQYLNEKINFSQNQTKVREDLKKERANNYESRMGINGLVNKQKLRSDGSSPGPGCYEIIGNSFKKNPASNCGQFGSIQKRFAESTFSLETPGPGSYVGLPKSQTATISGTLHKLLVKPKKPKTDDESHRPDLTLFPKNGDDEDTQIEKNKQPSVGQYNSDILFSLGYKIAKNVNKFNNVNAPFNSVEKRFLSYNRKTAANNIGPGEYYKERLTDMRHTVSNSPPFNTSADRTGGNQLCNLYTVGTTGPGSYNLSSYFDWNKKSYNIQYI